MKIENKTIKCKDGVTLAATRYLPDGKPEGTVVICSALGVPQKIYQPFSMFLSENGLDVLTFDYRGIGKSTSGIPKGKEIKMQDWGALDIDAVLGDVLQKADSPVFIIGHSAGGQLIGMSPHSRKIKGAIFTPASSANWRLYPAPFCFALYLIWHILIPVFSLGRNQFPAKKLGISSMDVPRGVMSQWARWARQPDYFFSDTSDINTDAYATLELPILAYGFDDDAYASKQAIDHLLAQFKRSQVTKHYIDTKELNRGGVGHFGFFKEKMKDCLWQDCLTWIRSHC